MLLNPPKALISRAADFWMLGGASLLVWLFMVVCNPFRGIYGIGEHFNNLVATMATLNLVVNYPHFLASYRLAYGRGRAFVLRHWWQTLALPLAMVAVFIWTFTLLSTRRSLAEMVLGAMVNLMFLTVGWHYVKQTFGVMMVYANYDGYRLTRVQRELIRYSLLALWLHSFAWSGRYGGVGELGGLHYRSWHLLLPRVSVVLTGLLLLTLVIGVLWKVVAANWQNRRPGLNFVTPYVAMFVWFAPWLRQTEYFLYTVPFFHSLQYLGFVYRVERFRADERMQARELRGVTVALVLLASGWLAFELVPGVLDRVWMRASGLEFFVLASVIFINIHHFFLDNVLWRIGGDPEVRKALLN